MEEKINKLTKIPKNYTNLPFHSLEMEVIYDTVNLLMKRCVIRLKIDFQLYLIKI